MTSQFRVGAALFLCAVLAACADNQETHAPATPQPAMVPVEVTGTLVLDDGRNICAAFPEGFNHSVRLIQSLPEADVNVGSVSMTCPNNQFTANLEPGTYIVRGFSDAFAEPETSYFTRLPFATLEVTEATTSAVITMPFGEVLNGYVTVDGVPVVGHAVSFRPQITDVPGFNFSSFAFTNHEGGYSEDSGSGVVRERVYLQRGVEYAASCGNLGGARLINSSPSPFVFGTDSRAFICRFRSSEASQWTHTNTQFDMSVGPGYFGRDDIEGGGGSYGVQYPSDIPSRDLNSPNMHMFNSGFLIASGNTILSTFDQAGFLDCTGTCGGIETSQERPNIEIDPSGDRRIVWRYDDSASPESLGLDIRQSSYDGTGGDYVLFRIVIQNTTASIRRLDVGFFADWDVAQDFGDASTGLVGDVAYATHAGAPFLGSVFLGSWPERAYRGVSNNGEPKTVAAQLDWLNGDANNAGAAGNDVWYVHGLPDVIVRPGATKTIWFAMLGGMNTTELAANAAAAEADMNARR